MKEQVFTGKNRAGWGTLILGLVVGFGPPSILLSSGINIFFWATGFVLVVLGLAQVLSPFKLVLREDGFATTAVFRTTFYPWEAVGELTAVTAGGREIVAFDVIDETADRAQTRLQMRAMAGHEIFLPPVKDISARELAELMNQCREQAIS